MKILSCPQGSPEWHAARAKCFNASEAPAMMGASKYMARNKLLHHKATGIQPEFDDATLSRFARGHAAEAGARPIVERMIDEDLYPTVATDDDGRLLASFDGITMDRAIGFEHKLWNEDLAAAVRAGEVGPEYYWQLEQQILVGGMEKIIFVCSDGTEENFVHTEYRAVPGRAEQLLAGWKQFAEDVANYKAVEVLPPLVAAPVLDLPAVSVKVAGQLMVTSNFEAFEVALRDFIDNRLILKPKNDQDFANLETQIKTLKKAEAALVAAEAAAVAQVSSIESMKRTKDMLYNMARDNRLMAEKLLEAEKENRRSAIVSGGREAFSAHVAALNQRIGKPYMPVIEADFAGAIKNKRTIASLQDAVDTLLAHKKIEANDIGDRIQRNLSFLDKEAAEFKFLFADEAKLVLKDDDAFQAVVKLRIAEHKQAEEKRLEAEREKIRLDMARSEIKGIQQQVIIAQQGRLGVRTGGTIECLRETLAETEAWPIDADRLGSLAGEAKEAKDQAVASIRSLIEKFEAEAAAKPASGEQNAQSDTQAALPSTGDTQPAAASSSVKPAPAWPFPTGKTESAAPAPADTGARIKLGEINESLSPISINAEGLAALGFQPVETVKNAKLYRASDFPAICAAMVRHIQTVASSATLKVAA